MKQFYSPVRIYTGSNALQALGSFAAKRVMIVTDRFFSQNGTAARIGGIAAGAQVRIFDEVTPDPAVELAAKGTSVCNEFRPQVLIALGGGSPMDCAKAIKLAYGKELTFVAIPTTSGSGSEMTSFSILSHGGVKHPLVDSQLRPDVAILDDSLLQQLPPSLIADTGMDLLAHCVEAAVACNRSSFSDAFAFQGAKTVFDMLERSYRADTQVRIRLHEAAAMAGAAFDNAGLGVCHALAHALGGAFHISHGKLCAMLLPGVILCNAQAASDGYTALAYHCGLSAATEKLTVRALIGAIIRLRKALSMPQNLAEAGVDKTQWQQKEAQIVQAAMKDACCSTNPVAVSEQLLHEVLKAVRP